ncbi:MAG: type II toxin-antitoxin system MqsA family antitoxin [FCB group bacterium]|jgi:YgiT-type zinc finger domain-containing protein
MICDICGTDHAKTRYISRIYGNKKNSYIIENVPVVSCTNCGESYLTAETMKNLDKIKKSKHYEEKSYPTAQFV